MFGADALNWRFTLSRGAWHRCIGDRCFHCLSPNSASQAHTGHQTRDGATRNSLTFAAQLPPGFANPVDLPVVVPDTSDFGPQRGITLLPWRDFVRVFAPRETGIICRLTVIARNHLSANGWSNWQHPANWLDSIDAAMIFNGGDHGLNGRASSA